jgi:methionyl-tRNA formyltransferase
VHVQCGKGSVSLQRVQQEGRQGMDIEAFLRGYSLNAGETLGR